MKNNILLVILCLGINLTSHGQGASDRKDITRFTAKSLPTDFNDDKLSLKRANFYLWGYSLNSIHEKFCEIEHITYESDGKKLTLKTDFFTIEIWGAKNIRQAYYTNAFKAPYFSIKKAERIKVTYSLDGKDEYIDFDPSKVKSSSSTDLFTSSEIDNENTALVFSFNNNSH